MDVSGGNGEPELRRRARTEAEAQGPLTKLTQVVMGSLRSMKQRAL